MAEIVGLVASIGTITAAGFKAARTIPTIASELGAAGVEIVGIATDLKAVSLILNELKRRLSKANNVTVEVLDVAYEIVALCKADIEGVEKFLIPLTSPSGQTLKFKDKVKWLFDKAKVSSRRASLDSLKLTLSLFLHTLDFIENGDDGSEDVAEHIKEEVCNLVVETQYTKTALLDAELSNANFESDEETLPPSVLQIEDGQSEPKDSDVEDRTVSRSPVYNEEHMQLTRLESQSTSTTSLERLSEDDFIEIAEHLRLQKVVRELALKIVHSPHERESHSEPSDEEKESYTGEWDDEETAHYPTAPPSKDRLEQELTRTKIELNGTKNELNGCLERTKMLQGVVEAYKAQERATQAEQRQREVEANIRQEAETAFQRRMEDMRLAQEEAKRDIEKARIEAEQAAREKIQAEQEEKQRRAREHAQTMAEAEEKARLRFEAEWKAKEERMAVEEQARRTRETGKARTVEEVLSSVESLKATQDIHQLQQIISSL